MKPVKTEKKPSYKDKLSNGYRLYYCPNCESNGYSIPDSRIALVYDDLMVSKGKAKLSGKRTGKAICLQCKTEFKVVGGEVVLMGDIDG